MEITEPKSAKELLQIEDFSSYVLHYLAEETPLTAVRCGGVQAEGNDFSGLDLRASVVETSVFRNCSFENASFTDVIFQSCDFSNSDFSGAFFERCRWSNCKCVGGNLRGSVLRQTVFQQTLLSYSCLDQARITDVLFHLVDFTEGSLSEAKLRNFSVTESRLIKNNFFCTLLAGVNFTTDELAGPVVSSTAEELKGAVITPFQAADLIGLWGIVVDRR
ncbi:pentapeptide repeat-containing protein [Faecalispora anaeroviscerum]|uniref:pentapeptide repeat-containing protein n=1 Tax=Faecalispora anaeroviscerum TaxID=2991836 RepID=UPI0024BBA1B7|nr:pentapeptide repeat-containing protein [Faecalispora anaeroviscerum]